MMLNRVGTWRMAVICGVGVAAAMTSGAKFANIWQEIPIERLVKSTEQYIAAHPKDPHGYYTLGRLHSLAWARAATARATAGDGQLPAFAPYEAEFGNPVRSAIPPDKKTAAHDVKSLEAYNRAVELDPRDGIAWLGIAWMLEKGSASAGETEIPDLAALGGKRGSRLSAEASLDRALLAYRRAYKLLAEPDKTRPLGVRTVLFSPEAGEGIIRLLSRKRLTESGKTEVDRIRREIAEIRARPHPITPIIVSFRPVDSVEPLLAAGQTSGFDLAGFGLKRRWPWVRPDTGILVWDPEGTGQIRSGTQLFGSHTWQMFWSDGYAALAGLDDNGDRWLTGSEMRGIAVWRDANGNGLSDRSEVVLARSAGIAAIAVSASGTRHGTLWNPGGLVMRSGARLPSFDWTPTSLP